MIKLNEILKTKTNVIMDNLKKEYNNLKADNDQLTIALTGTYCDADFKFYLKKSFFESLQYYITDNVKSGINSIDLYFFFDLYNFDKFGYSEFVDSLSESDLKNIKYEIKKYFSETMDLDPMSYDLDLIIKTINDPDDYGELVKITATISI